MSETILWNELNSEMQLSARWHATRVESHALSSGIPDVDYCFSGDGHIELKWGFVNKKMPEIRDSQIRWITKRTLVGGKVFILTKLEHSEGPQYLVHKGDFVSQLRIGRDYEYWFNNRINDNYWKLDRTELGKIFAGGR